MSSLHKFASFIISAVLAHTAFAGGPVNDSCDNAIEIGLGFHSFSTLGATTDGNSHAGCTPNSQTYNDIWFDFTAGASGTLQLSTCGSVDYDSDLVIYFNETDNCESLIFAECNDDADGCSGWSSYLEIEVEIGDRLKIRVGGYGASDFGEGTFSLDIVDEKGSPAPSPQNDNCIDAMEISEGETHFTTLDATTDGPAHNSCEVSGDDGVTGNDVWYSYLAPASGSLTLSTCDNANYDTDLVVYSGSNCKSLTLLDCNDDGDGCSGYTSELVVNVNAGSTYLIRVGGFEEGDQGTGVITLTLDGAQVDWIGKDGESWFDSNNWSSGVVPTASVDVAISGSVNIDGEGAIAKSVVVNSGGQLTLSSSRSELTTLNLNIESGGQLTWDAGTINISNGQFSISDHLYIGCNESASLIADQSYIYADSVTICDNGYARGYFRAYADSFINHGTIELGGHYSYSKIYGTFEQSADGIMIVGIESDSVYDQLKVDDGETIIAGTLICESVNGYSPPDDTTITEIIDNYDGLHEGTFDAVVANGFDAGTNVLQITNDDGINIEFSVDTIWYVDGDNSTGTGLSWNTAFPTLQAALAVADQNEQIWIKTGTYYPGNSSSGRDSSFIIPNRVSVYGGFDGTETSNTQRNPQENPTILSGNIGEPESDDDVYHVVTYAPSEWSYAVLDSLTITRGMATGNANQDQNVGGGVFNKIGTLFINNCFIVDNGADDNGGGLYSDDGWLSMTNCIIEDNVIVDVQGGGPGPLDDLGGNGGGITLKNLAGSHLHDCMFIGNYSSYGGAVYSSDSTCYVSGSEFINNRALLGGGAIRMNSGVLEIANSSFENNRTTSLILGEGAGGAIYAKQCNTKIETSVFSENQTSGYGGGVYFDENSINQVPLVNGCIFELNTAYRGSAFYASDVSSNYAYIANSLIASNNGPAVHLSNQSTGSRITNCTIAGNVEMFASAAVTGIASIENSIIWGNVGLFGRNNIFNQINGSITLSDSIIDLWNETYNSTFPNQYVSSNDPLFRSKKGDDGIAGTGDEDFRLLPTSPAIDEGWDGSHDFPSVSDDLDGLSRFEDDPFTSNKFANSTIDLGCYEFVPQLAGESGYRVWNSTTEKKLFSTGNNWLPTEAPNSTDMVVVSGWGSFIHFNQDATVKQFEAISGIHELILNGQTLKVLGNKNSLNIAHHLTNSVFELGIVNGTVEADNVDVSATGNIWFNEGILRSDEPVLIRNNANIYGKGTIDADVYLAGDHLMDSVNRRYPDINGDYYLSEYPTEEITGSGKVIFYLRDYIDSDGEAKFNVDGTAYLGGVLQIGAWNHTLNIGEAVTILETTEGISGNFDSVLANGFRDDEVPIISIVSNATGGQSLIMTLNSISELVGFSDPDSTSLNAVPDDVELADFDGDGFVDLVLSLPDENANSGDTDEILILFNGGTSSGEWNGFSGGSQQISVGNTPAGITTGDFDGDGDIDIAVANKDDDTISALENQPNLRGNPSFVLFEIDAGYYTEETVRPADVTAGKFSNSGEMDLAIANSGDSMMVVINGPIFSASLMPSGSQNDSPGGARSIDPGDVNNDKDLDAINVSNDNGKTNSFKGTSMAAGGLGYGDPIVLDMGVTIAEQLIIDIDGNGNDDILVCDPESNAIVIALQKADGTYKTPAILALDAAQEGGGDIWYVNPKSLTAFDIDADGDLDLAIVAENNNAEKATAIYRNDSSGNLLLLSLVDEQGAGTNPILAKSGDLDSDGYEDLLMIGENADQLAGRNDYAGTTESALNDLGKSNPCPSDLNGDNHVNVDDLLLLIAAWGNTSGDEDINSDGSVNVDDMLLLIAAWGSCPR